MLFNKSWGVCIFIIEKDKINCSASCQDSTMAVATTVIIGLQLATYPMQEASPLPRNVCTTVNVPLANLWLRHPQIAFLVL